MGCKLFPIPKPRFSFPTGSLNDEDTRIGDCQAKQGEKIIVRIDAEVEDSIPDFFETLHKEIGAALEQTAKDHNSEEVRKRADELLIYLERLEVVYE